MAQTAVASSAAPPDLKDLAANYAGKLADPHFERVQELGLARHALDLEVKGYTVIPAELVAPPEFAGRVTDALLRVAEKRTGIKHALDRDGAHGRYLSFGRMPTQYQLYYLLFEGEVFEEWLENPVMSALVNYVLKGDAQLSGMLSFIKWRGDAYGPGLGLHADSPNSPDGAIPANFELVCNCALALTDYTKDNGALAIVPGSHRQCRQPLPGEGVKSAIPVEAPVGSLIFWKGGTWHGAYPKLTDGLRVNLTTYFVNRNIKTQERYQRAVPTEMLERHSEQFARYLGADDPLGWGELGGEPTYLKTRLR
jgi:hypothetical protein